jgi:hypothetical protein
VAPQFVAWITEKLDRHSRPSTVITKVTDRLNETTAPDAFGIKTG